MKNVDNLYILHSDIVKDLKREIVEAKQARLQKEGIVTTEMHIYGSLAIVCTVQQSTKVV